MLSSPPSRISPHTTTAGLPPDPTSPSSSQQEQQQKKQEQQDGQYQQKKRHGSGSINDPESPTGSDKAPRRLSVQFEVASSEAKLKSERHRKRTKSHPVQPRQLPRIPSPPPPSSYNRGVSFDTFDNRDATDYALTLNYKHKNYQSTRRSRTFLCGTDTNDYSDFALEWLMDELVDDGDEIVCLRAVEKDSKIASDSSVEEGRHRQEAERLFQQVIAKNSTDEKAISLVMELAVGKVQSIIQRMIQIYEPAALIVGTRGRSLGGMQGLLPGSVSKYCLQQSPIPVIVVRPSQKREKKKKKRLADPARKSYNHILRMSEAKGSSLFDISGSENSSQTKLVEEDEAAAVARAIGLPSAETVDHLGERISRSNRSSRDFSASQASEDDADAESAVTSTRSDSVSVTDDIPSLTIQSPEDKPGDSAAPSGDGGNDNGTPASGTTLESGPPSLVHDSGDSLTDSREEKDHVPPSVKHGDPVIVTTTPVPIDESK